MRLNDFVLLLGNTSRSKAYLQCLIKNDLLPGRCIVFALKEELGQIQGIAENEAESKMFDRNESLIVSLEKAGVLYEIVENKDINSKEMLEKLCGVEQKYVIYSGYGGAILRKPLFQIGKKFIHVHAGILPYYRGSTTAYYSILNEGYMGATAIFMNEQIDEGEILCSETFKPIPDVDIDYIFEPYTRAMVLVKCLKEYVDRGYVFEVTRQMPEEAETYFIIHPVLKHLALEKVFKEKNA